jgi:hypothetical protein
MVVGDTKANNGWGDVLISCHTKSGWIIVHLCLQASGREDLSVGRSWPSIGPEN